MQAYIYNDDKGDDITVTDIPEDMKDDAELYRTELVEKICELDDDLMMMYLDGEEPSVEELKKVLRKATCECPGDSGMLRYCLQKQGRSEASGCCDRVHAVSHLTSRPSRALTWMATRSCVTPPTTSRSLLLRSRS